MSPEGGDGSVDLTRVLVHKVQFAAYPVGSLTVSAPLVVRENLLLFSLDGRCEIVSIFQAVGIEHQPQLTQARVQGRRTRGIFVADQPCPSHVRQVAAAGIGVCAVEVDQVMRPLIDEDEVARRQIAVTNDLGRICEPRSRSRVVERADETNGGEQLGIASATPL
jgi:hypothetical protein